MSEIQKQMADEFIKAKKAGKRFLIGGPGYLQTFATQDDDPGDDDPGDDDPGDDDPGDDDPGDDDPGDDDPGIEYSKGLVDSIMTSNKLDFNQLLKDNPGLKKAYTDRFNKNMSKRMGKFEGVDVEEYNDLKKRAGEGKLEGDAKTWKDKHDALLVQVEETSQRTAIQQTAIESGLDAEQIAFVTSMIKVSNLEKDDEGEWMGIEDEIERIQEKFPRMFSQTASGDENDDQDNVDNKKQKYNPGKKKHNQDSKTLDPKEKGRLKAIERMERRKKK